MSKKKVKIDHFLFFSKKFSVKMMFLELFCDVLHHERPHFDLAVSLRRWYILRNNLRTVREVRHVCYCELCAPASSFPCFINSVVPVSRMSDHERGPEEDEEETNMLVVFRMNVT